MIYLCKFMAHLNIVSVGLKKIKGVFVNLKISAWSLRQIIYAFY